jgi:hypothetical protein
MRKLLILIALSVWTSVAAGQTPVPAPPPDTTPLAGTGPFLDRVAAIADRAEALETGQPVDQTEAEITRDVGKAATQLTAYLNSHPKDVRALILSVRLARFQKFAQPLVIQGGDKVPTFASLAAEYAPYHAALNRALKLEPKNAEAHYWQARLYGQSHHWMGMLYGAATPTAEIAAVARAYGDSAVRYGRRAVELAPDRIQYREALAIYLILTQQEQEAAAVLRDVAGGHHPMSMLLADWQAIPVPAGATSLPRFSQGIARMEMTDESMADYPFLRVRMYVVTTPADSVQAFYRSWWPSFQLIQTDDQQMGDARMRMYSQYLRWQGGQLVPAQAKSAIPDEPVEGIGMILIEIVNPPAEVRQQFPIPLGSVFSALTFVNLRGFEATDSTGAVIPGQREAIAAMKSDLRNLVTAEEVFWADSEEYTSKIGPGGVDFRPSEGNTLLSLEITEDGWVAKMSRANTATICAIYVGSTPIPPATKEGVPACR